MENNNLEDLFIIVEGKPVILNFLGVMQYGEKRFVVLNDMPELDIAEDEFEIVELIETEEAYSIKGIDDEAFYDLLCGMWEGYIEEFYGVDDV